MKFNISKCRNYEFEGSVLDENLPQKYQDLLDLDKDREFTNDIKIDGEFEVQWDDDIPMPVLKSLFLDNGNKIVEMNIEDLGNELFDLEEQISQSGLESDWEVDRVSRAADQAYDDYKDREMFGDD